MPLRTERRLDNLTYILSKDATSGARAGFDVQRMRNRLTEIEYDINHIQGDIDDILTEDITALWNAINELRAWTTQELNDLRSWTTQELNDLRTWTLEELTKLRTEIDAELTYIKTNYEHFETGTRLLFHQAAAPAGWSIVPGLEDAAVRIVAVNGGAVTSGQGFPTVFAPHNVSATTLSLNQIPSHNHSASSSSAGSHSHTGSGSASSSGAHTHSLEAGTSINGNVAVNDRGSMNLHSSQTDKPSNHGYHWESVRGIFASMTAASAGAHTHSVSVSVGSAGSHSHSISVGSSGGGQSHTHSIDLTIKHICVIVCQKEIVF